MKLIVQIPAYDEADHLEETLRDVPRSIEGTSSVEILVIDDGSTDDTAKVAARTGADHVISLPSHRGLARAFQIGIETCLKLGADIIVNTDADNQYSAADIPRLIGPILEKKADIVIGQRGTRSWPYASRTKNFLQVLGSWVVRKCSGTEVRDVTSGFRAYSREAAMRLNVFSNFTYTIENLIQAGVKNMTVVTVPISTNPPQRTSRLFKSSHQYVLRSSITILLITMLYRPLHVFSTIGVIFLAGAFALGIRLVIFYLSGGRGMAQSLIVFAILVLFSLHSFLLGFFAHLFSINRLMEEESLYRLRKVEFDRSSSK